MTLTQVDGLYSLIYQTNTKFEVQKLEHEVRAPLYGSLALGRRFNDKWEVTQTSAYNILVAAKAPAVSIHYLNLEKRYKGEAAYEKDLLKVTAGASLPEKSVEDDVRETYTVDISKQF
jgi:hypothetical protein